MNKIYALKYSYITGGLIAVSEFTKKVAGKTNRKLAATIISLTVAGTANASTMDITNVWARDYLDLAQNKGIFTPGAENVKIKLKNEETFSFHNLTIPDFSSAAASGAVTSVGGAYSVTVEHNKKNINAAETQKYGQTTYKVVDRKNNNDFEIQRLNKFVVETSGVNTPTSLPKNYEEALKRYGITTESGERKIIGFHVGSGITSFLNGTSAIYTSQTYTPELLSANLFEVTNWDYKGMFIYKNNNTFRNLDINGDSGSGAYLYDNELKQWVLAGTAHGISTQNGEQITLITKYNQSLVDSLKSAHTHNVETGDNSITTLKTDGSHVVITGKNGTTESQYQSDNSTDLLFQKGGTINLENNIDLVYGGLIFDEGHKYTINGKDSTFKGAGIDIGKNSTVDWNIKYASNDDLHKIGEGTLNVLTKQDTNIKIGEGNVILNKENTFNNIYLASGNGKVTLNADNALGNKEFSGLFFTSRGGTLDLNGHNQSFTKIAAADKGAIITNTNNNESILSVTNNKNDYIYHGHITGNTRLQYIADKDKNSAHLILDGGINTNNDIEIENTKLVMQGHATEHATFGTGNTSCFVFICGEDWRVRLKKMEDSVNKKFNSYYKTNNEVASFEQPDWETGMFKFDTLYLKNADFYVSRNAHVEGNIEADKSDITIGSTTAYIDKNAGKNITGSGYTFQQTVNFGSSVGQSRFIGSVITNGGSFSVGNNADVTLTKSSSMSGTSVQIAQGGKLTALGGLYTSSEIINEGDVTLQGYTDENNTTRASIYMSDGGYKLKGSTSSLTAQNQASVIGDIHSDDESTIIFGQVQNNEKPLYTQFSLTLLDGFNTTYQGNISAEKSSLSMNDALWKVTGNSALNKMTLSDSMTLFQGTFRTLTVNELTANNSAFVMRTNTQQADQLIVKNKLEGANNLLLVDFIEKDPQNKKLAIPLVTAPEETRNDVFTTSTRTIGFSDVTPVIENKTNGNEKTWTLTGYQVKANQNAAKTAQSLMSGGYKSFLSEVNNLNKRMGDLRDINGEAGAWARIMSGAGSSGGGYSDNYTHVQIGADKKHELDGLDLFTGLTMTYTDSHAGSHDFSGETKSVGAGLYASAMFDSGAYIDLIGKYVHHDNEYTATFAGLGTKDYSSHSWYAGAEVGYRYHVTEDAWIEPQAELVYGAVSGKQFSWKDQGMSLSMKDKDFNPLIGRTGIDVGKSFSGKDWKVTARAGIGYQFDLLANGETVLRDASGEKRIKGEKDGRMLMNVGLNAEIRDNVRFGLEFEKSAFGKYNVDNAINANFRYTF
ncbi:TPA: autotransporter outer membrane beta-barrel domain-containing protein [Escherichia coli]|nr:autotransporter outer membrane beta-barrel domain-containing protein [Escherichia coli]